MSHFSRFPSAVRMNAPLRVPTRTRTPLIQELLPLRWPHSRRWDIWSRRSSLLLTEAGRTGKQDEPFNYFTNPKSFSQFPACLGKWKDFLQSVAQRISSFPEQRSNGEGRARP